MAITYRSLKGSPLLDSEVDGNFADLAGRVEGWNDLVQNVVVQQAAPNAPTLGLFRDGIYAYLFDPIVTMECFANFHLGHDYVGGTMIYPHVHWSPISEATGTVRWVFEYTWARRGDGTGQTIFGPTQQLPIEVTIGLGNRYKHMVNESTDGNGIPGLTMEVDSLILCRIFRDGSHPNDTFPDNVALLTVDMHYQSARMSTPLRTPPFF